MEFLLKLVALTMCVVMSLGIFSIGALASDISANEEIGAKCLYDAYYETTSENVKTINSSNALYCGTVYNRYVSVKFDITPFVEKEFGGSVLGLTVRNAYDSNVLTFYGSYDGKVNNAEMLTTYRIKVKGKMDCNITVTDFVKKAIEKGEREVTFFIKSNMPATTVFSMENTDKSIRPSLVICDEEPFFKGQMDFVYPSVSKEMFKADLKKSIAKGHPWMFGTEEDFDRVRDNAFGQNKYLTDMYAKVKATASSYIGKAPSNVDEILQNVDYNTRAAECLTVIQTCSFVYKIEALEEYAQRAYEEVEVFVNLKSWGTSQYIDNSHPVLALAICYDWLYDWLGAERRDKIVAALKSNHFDTIYDLYANPDSSKYTKSFYRHVFGSANHALIDNTCNFLASMAIADTDIEYSTFIMQESFKTMKGVVENYYPDSGWFEGLGYWGYTGVFMGRWFVGMQKGLGTTYGLTDYAFLNRIADYPIYGSGQYTFVVNDSFYEYMRPMSMTYALATFNGDPQYEKYALMNDTGSNVINCLSFKTDVDYDKVELKTFSLDKLFRDTDMLTMRNTWEGNQPLFCGMFVQDANKSHGVMNSGTLALEALGELWITNIGRDSYSLDGYWDSVQNGKRWQYYFSRPEANSCLVINPGLEGGQIINSGDTIGTFVTKNKGVYGISDLTATYKDYASSYKRGAMLTDDRTKFVVQDEVELFKPREVYSFINFNKCDSIKISEDQKSVIVSKKNKKIMVRISSDADYELSVMGPTPLPTSPQLDTNKLVRGMKRIAVHYPSVEKFNLRFEFIPYLTDEELSQASDEIIPLEEWNIPDGELDVMGVESISLDGVEIADFNPANRCYVVDTLPEKIEYTADESRYEIDTKINNEKSAKYLVLRDKSTGRYFSYMFELAQAPKEVQIIDTTGYNILSISNVSATTDDGNVPENTIDGNMSTRWSASGLQSITWELSGKSNVHCIAVAFHSGDKRQSYFDMEVSADGKEWKTVSNCESSGKTLDFEYYDLKDEEAKFVRFSGYGNSANQWNSVTEVKIYGK